MLVEVRALLFLDWSENAGFPFGAEAGAGAETGAGVVVLSVVLSVEQEDARRCFGRWCKVDEKCLRAYQGV